MLTVTTLLLGLIGTPTPAAAPWTFEGRQVSRRSTSRTDLLIEFTLRPDEDPVAAVQGCLRATRSVYSRVNYIYCAAYSPQAYQLLSGKLRLCYSVILNWFGADDVQRLSLAGDDSQYPKRCPAPVLPIEY